MVNVVWLGGVGADVDDGRGTLKMLVACGDIGGVCCHGGVW